MKNIVAKEYLAYKEAFSGVMSPKEEKIGMSLKYI